VDGIIIKWLNLYAEIEIMTLWYEIIELSKNYSDSQEGEIKSVIVDNFIKIIDISCDFSDQELYNGLFSDIDKLYAFIENNIIFNIDRSLADEDCEGYFPLKKKNDIKDLKRVPFDVSMVDLISFAIREVGPESPYMFNSSQLSILKRGHDIKAAHDRITFVSDTLICNQYIEPKVRSRYLRDIEEHSQTDNETAIMINERIEKIKAKEKARAEMSEADKKEIDKKALAELRGEIK